VAYITTTIITTPRVRADVSLDSIFLSFITEIAMIQKATELLMERRRNLVLLFTMPSHTWEQLSALMGKTGRM
jgi:hypothetical protein